MLSSWLVRLVFFSPKRVRISSTVFGLIGLRLRDHIFRNSTKRQLDWLEVHRQLEFPLPALPPAISRINSVARCDARKNHFRIDAALESITGVAR